SARRCSRAADYRYPRRPRLPGPLRQSAPRPPPITSPLAPELVITPQIRVGRGWAAKSFVGWLLMRAPGLQSTGSKVQPILPATALQCSHVGWRAFLVEQSGGAYSL